MSEQFVVEDQSAVASFLGNADTHGGEQPSRIDTHGAMVFVTKDRVYKIKRAVDFSYMDFSMREKRLAALQEENRVNRRTTPELYLGIAPIVEGQGGLRLGQIGEDAPDAIEHVLVMRRFEATFDEIAAQGGLRPDHISSIAEQVAALHKAAEPHHRLDPAARVRAAIAGARPIAIGIHKEDDLMVAQTLRRAVLTQTTAQSFHDIRELLVVHHLSIGGLLRIENLAAEGQDCLGLTVPTLFG